MSNDSSSKPYAFNPDSLTTPPPTYRQVCVTPIKATTKMVTLAGQTGTRKDGTIAEDISFQAADAYLHVHDGLQAAGATMRDIVSNPLDML
jgi:enamine deaminase RidA (YjgF/YER057c/UK114 family)